MLARALSSLPISCSFLQEVDPAGTLGQSNKMPMGNFGRKPCPWELHEEKPYEKLGDTHRRPVPCRRLTPQEFWMSSWWQTPLNHRWQVNNTVREIQQTHCQSYRRAAFSCRRLTLQGLKGNATRRSWESLETAKPKVTAWRKPYAKGLSRETP